MKRNAVEPRKGWTESVEADGLVWHTVNGVPYWDETAYYSFTSKQIEEIEDATEEVHRLFVDAGDYVVNNRLLHKFGIPDYCHDAIYKSWHNEPVALNYGRFDFGYDGINPPKLFEFNCDTPTSLLEASIVQWNWKEQVFPSNDQFNGIHEALVARWKTIKPYLNENYVHFAYSAHAEHEDALNVAYMCDTAEEAGLEPITLTIDDIGYDTYEREFVDLNNVEIESIYKLYPWEWLVNEEIGKRILEVGHETQWIEPIWKMIWSNKAILPILWQLFPGHENLLGASFFNVGQPNFVKKPILAREGSNIEIVFKNETIAKSEGDYVSSPCVYQEFYAIPDFGGGRYPIIGSWAVDGAAVGMGIREDGLITGNAARFIPHIIEG